MFPKRLHIHNPTWFLPLPVKSVERCHCHHILHVGHGGSGKACHLPEVPQMGKAEVRSAWFQSSPFGLQTEAELSVRFCAAGWRPAHLCGFATLNLRLANSKSCPHAPLTSLSVHPHLTLHVSVLSIRQPVRVPGTALLGIWVWVMKWSLRNVQSHKGGN